MNQPDFSVCGKGLASASGVKRPSFQYHQAVIGGSLRSTLKRARAGDSEDSSSAATSDPEQADCIITISDNETFHFTGFYGSPDASKRMFTWELLDKLYYNAPTLPWLIMGDFNSYLFHSDKYGSTRFNAVNMDTFSKFLNKFHLFPLPFIGNKYTWTNNTIFERLDWAIVSDSWCNLFPSAALHHLPYYGSDHRALKVMVTQNVPNHHPHSIKRFHFENVWLENPDFYTTLNNAWGSSSHNVSTVGAYSRFLHSQKASITSLTSWGRSVGNSFKPRIAYLQKEIERLQSIHPRDSDTLSHIKHIQSQLDALLYREEVYWRQRARVNWLRAGDRNTTVEDMSNFVLSYFEDLFHCDGCDTEAVNHILDCLGFPFEDLEIDFLNQPFMFDEVQKAVFQLSGDKAPGLDGLNAYFYQRNWDTVGVDLINAVLDCLNNGADFSEVNGTLIVLIPKKRGLILDQLAFVQPSIKVIFDNILIAQEVVHAINTRKHGKSGWAALKLDMAKAFDRVNWHYLESVMLHFNFPVSFVSLIMKCVTTSSLSFLVNGLSSLLCAHQCSGSLKGISISRRAPSISHLLFADDSLIFCSTDRDSCSSLRNIFHLYSIASRSKYHSFAFLKDRVLSVLPSWSGFLLNCVKELKLRWLDSGGDLLAMLEKQAWKILKQPNSLLCRVLKARYFPNSSILEAVPGHNPSYAWRSILWGRDLMASGLIWKIGDGENILTIDDHWIPNKKYLCYKDGILPPSTKLSFFISDSGYWDSTKLRNHFYESDIQDILEVPITGFSGKDDIIWSRESSGLFTVKSAYHLALSTQDIPSSSSAVNSRKFWNKIWHSQAPPKIKHFMWRVVSHTIPVASNLFVRHILYSPLCSFCKSSLETVHHALLGCSRLRKAWKSSRFLDHYHKYKHLDITDFLLCSFEALDKDYISILFCFLWALWNQRNNYIHHHTVMPAADIFDWSVNYFFQYIDAQKNIQTCSVAAQAPSMVSDGVSGSSLQVYTDAAIDNCGQRHSFGIVVVDNSGLMKAGVVKPCIGGIPAIIAEAKAIYHALQWVQLLHLPVDILKTDCKTIVDKLNSCNWNASPLDDILMGIKNLLSFSPNLRIEHVYRDSSQLAHWAAKLGLGLDNELVWNGSLPSL
ncbi:hypothetical protein CsatB_003120 [Cannabis sativa]|uniref:uncharacterized protein LOC115717884 n=1 Tax=Cannabis sativa TaxID=3483 RepID=UPI0029CA0067|nr:uncharacterized protein LOC115717884 [Cannabis sativa]